MTEEVRGMYLKYEQALRNMNPEGWNNLLPNERIEALQAIENVIAYDTKRIPAEVVIGNCKPGSVAMQVGNSIIIDKAELAKSDYIECVKSVYHEASHVLDFQASIFSRLREQVGAEELALRNTPIPEYTVDFAGYYNHPAEVAAREAEVIGVQRTIEDQQHIAAVDEVMHQSGNQILASHDYVALDYGSGVDMQSGIESNMTIEHTAEMTGFDD